MTFVTLFVALFASVAPHPVPAAFMSSKIRILVVTRPAEPPSSKVGSLTETKVITKFVNELQKLYPCASVVTRKELDMQMRPSLDVELHGNEGWWGRIAEAMDADLIFNVELGVSRPPDPVEHYMNTTAVDPYTAQVPHRNVASAPGSGWAANDLVDQEMAELRKETLNVCPWLGTVQYTRTVKMDSIVKVTTDDVVETTEDVDNSSDDWTLTLDRVRMGPVFITSKGSSKPDTRYDVTQVSKNVTCFKMVDGVVRDDHLVSGVTRTVVTHRSFKGMAGDSLFGIDFKLQPLTTATVNAKDVWYLAVMAGAVGPPDQSGEDYEELSGGCGAHREDKPKQNIIHMPLSVGILFAVDSMSVTGYVMAGTRALPDKPYTHETVKWDLHRN